ncbi:GNAT family N-acetyltransferase [Plantactinospora soyae]|uniref:GNAT superfamily N-acetyltransferase n=1 Tax=Plantactinospora soyae TaxID=1544732 RepID=A0A927MAW3_9ACTN|nr:GNAT family N-acetyltransferase [Plantactinospora soyae]MBE1491197.1 GNAT superfamily N-acetyltransferase [Plantactinospora soyae]
MGEEPPQTIVRQCTQRDVVVLERHVPTGRNHYHDARYRRQSEGLSTFLIAYSGDVPVGSGEVLWQGAKEAEVRDRFPDCPEINGLAVVPARRSQGIGTAIIRVAERLAVRRGRHWLGMGVDDHIPRAAALYRRLGYRDADCRYLDRYQYIDDHGVRHEVADPCRFLIKAVSGAPD